MSGVPTREVLEAKLNWNEAQRETLEKKLAIEKQRTVKLESDSRTLAEIHRLLEGDATRPTGSSGDTLSPEDFEADPTASGPGTLSVQTPHGLWPFRPPFELEPDEVELVRLVAGEDEITAEQIRRRTGRRRAVDDLDDLLDRLHAEGLEPIKENSDRYSFDPEILQS